MPYTLELPDIGEGVVEAEVQQWFVEEGQVVGEDEPLVEVMTDKATVTIPSPRRGRVLRRFWKVGDVAKVHAPLVELELEAEEGAAAGTAGEPAHASSLDSGAAARPVRAGRTEEGAGPVGSESAGGRSVDEEPVRVDSLDSGASHPRSGQAESRQAPEPPSARRHEGAASVAANLPHPAPPGPPRKALATPAVRALARELAIDIDAVQGTGPGGRVTKDDLRGHRQNVNGHARRDLRVVTPAEPPPATPAPRAPAPAASAEDERVPLRGVRKRIAENMARSKRTAAHFTFVEQCDVTELARVKDRIAAAAKEEGVKVTFLPFVVKAVVAALRKHPKLNASMDDERGELVLHRRYDVGIASATDAGLVVPVVRGADRRSIVELAREIARLGADTKAGRARPEDMGRSTFTITSLGALGGLLATPVLNYPEVAILGLHRIRPTPVVKDGQVVVRDVMNVSVTSDHRVVDGHEAAAFCYEVIRTLEDPNLLFMHMV